MSTQEKLDHLYRKTSSKWRRYPLDVLPMHVAEMDFEVGAQIRAEIVNRVNQSDLGYLGPIPELGEAMQGFALSRWGWQLDPKLVSPVVDVGVAAVEMFRVLAKPGDSVLINSPVYTNFFNWIDEAKLNVIDVPLIKSTDNWTLDLDGIESAFKSGVKLFLICNPQNPVGRVHSKVELEVISQLAGRYGVFVVSDEIHAPLTYLDQTFTPYLSIPNTETGYVITSASKSWNIAGLKAAVIVSGSKAAAAKISTMPPAVHWRTSIIGAFAMVTALNCAVDWLDETLLMLDKNRKLLKTLLAELLPAVEYELPESSYLAWLNLAAFGENDSWHNQLVTKGKVAIVPGQDFGKQYKNYVRLNFATYPEVLIEGVNRMKIGLG